MSDLRPKGTPLVLGGEKHSILFTLNAVDEIQDKADAAIDDVIDRLTNPREAWRACKTILCCLLNDESQRKKFYGEITETKTYTEDEVGWLVTEGNKYEVVTAILSAYGADLPETEDESPKAESVQQTEKS